MRSRLYTFLSILLLATLLFTMVGCANTTEEQTSESGSSNSSATPTPIPPPESPETPTYVVSRGTVVKSVELSGNVSPVLEEDLSFPVAGRVKAVYVQRGDVVEAGTLLIELENDDILSSLAQAQIDLDNAENNLNSSSDSLEYSIQQAQINLTIKQLQLQELQQSTVDEDLTIQEINLEKAAITLQQAQAAYDRRTSQPGYEASSEALNLQQATLNYEAAQANYNKAVAAVSQHEIDVQIMEQQLRLSELALEHLEGEVDPQLVNAVEKARISLEQVQIRLDQTRIYSTIDGTVSAVAPSEGTTVTAYKTQVIVADDSELEITSDPGSTDISELWEGMDVSIVFSSMSSQTYEGIIELMPYPYGTSGASDLDEDDPLIHISMDMTQDDFKSGAGCIITAVIEEHEDALWLPPAALREYNGRYFVLVEIDGVESRVDIEVGIISDDRVEILSGLEEGQVVLGQ